jgi:hypothetical protein
MEKETLEAIVTALTQTSPWAMWRTIAMLGLVATAILAAIYATHQISEARVANEQSLHQARAAFLLQLNERWHDLIAHRITFGNVRKSLFDQICADDPDDHNENRMVELRKRSKTHFIAEQRKFTDEFQHCVQYVSFFEFAGMMANKEYIPVQDIIELYEGPLVDIEIMFVEFIKEWQKDPRFPPGLFKNLLFLIGQLPDHGE